MTQRLNPQQYRRMIFDLTWEQITSDLREKKMPQPGAKNIAIEAYKKGGKEKAYKAIEEQFNKKIGRKVYTKEIIDSWIDDYEQSKKGRKQDDTSR